MTRDFKKEKKRESYSNNSDNEQPINDAMDHLNKVEGYPVKKPAKLKSLPLPIRIIGYIVITFMGLGFLSIAILNFIQ